MHIESNYGIFGVVVQVHRRIRILSGIEIAQVQQIVRVSTFRHHGCHGSKIVHQQGRYILIASVLFHVALAYYGTIIQFRRVHRCNFHLHGRSLYVTYLNLEPVENRLGVRFLALQDVQDHR